MDPQPLITHLYTADPSAHVFNDRIYIYPSHDVENDKPENFNGDHFDMQDYHVFSSTSPQDPITDHGVVLRLQDIPWAKRQLWAPDAAECNGKYYLYFPARDKDEIFRIGVAVSYRPEGPFVPDPEPIAGSYSIDPASFVDDDGEAYLYFGGIHGGQLQCWSSGSFSWDKYHDGEPLGPGIPALFPRVAKLGPDMRCFSSKVQELAIFDENDQPILSTNPDKRFFEAAWMHKYGGRYYFSYSTGTTHFLVYAVGDSPFGPFRYRGRILEPVEGWTTHHSIVQFRGKWYLYYHDSSLSKLTQLRCIKVREIFHDAEGSIRLLEPQASTSEQV
ncbi:hypothetical protein CKM354_001237100 [Cercospora kikuchii]|uniref:Uncharacterized protein n=1 Tax=Cercospora kikuchii TaxID=84275 RepID=A0A9P3FLW8_9PEZI|nr:uncharacterized protein CKM354_001237100 [Cercospora kikuchii]GIZ49339.1 hypothetical protein CKM354_001237100 [Cercospora kikuchii]